MGGSVRTSLCWMLSVARIGGQSFPQGTVNRVLAEHVVEHWSETGFRRFLRTVRPFLSEGGIIRVAVPDGYHPDPDYIYAVAPECSGGGAEDHKVLYNYLKIAQLLREESYELRLLGYFDESGKFHSSPWDPEDGMVRRSAKHDPRNKETPLSYTSLIVDFWPS